MTNCDQLHPADRSLGGLQSDFRARVVAWLAEVPGIAVHEAWRSAERQACLRASGASQVARSNHQDGLAVDVHFKIAPHFPAGDDPRWNPVRDAARRHGLISGWDLWKWDANHFQDIQTTNPITPEPETYLEIMKREVPAHERLFNVYDQNDPMIETKSLIEIGLHRLQKKHGLL